jgi:hypothetical protein
VLEEGRNVALESDLADDRFHLAADARDFGEADAVNLISAELFLAGPEPDPVFIVPVAVRQLPHAVRPGGPGAQGFDARQDLLEPGTHRATHCGDARIQQPFLVRVRNVELVHLAAEIGQQSRIRPAVVEWHAGQHGAPVGQHRIEGIRGRHDAAIGRSVH